MAKRKKFNITRTQALDILCKITDQDNMWEMLVDDFYDEKTDSMPEMADVLEALGVTREETDAAIRRN
jgi:hypothetical protein